LTLTIKSTSFYFIDKKVGIFYVMDVMPLLHAGKCLIWWNIQEASIQ